MEQEHLSTELLSLILFQHLQKNLALSALPVTSLKSKLGHTMGSAGMDQLWGALGAMETQNCLRHLHYSKSCRRCVYRKS
ncbi:MAG: hypothetical protein ACJ0GO_00830 [Gammaproteobacteria bacterium]